MTTYLHTCEGTDAEAITTGNAPAGSSNFSSVTIGTSATLEYDTAVKLHGTSSIKVAAPVAGSAGRSFAYWSYDASVRKCVSRMYLYLGAAPAATSHVMSMCSGAVRQAQTAISTARAVVLQDSGGTTKVGPVLSLDTWYRLEQVVDEDALTFKTYIYDGEGLSPIDVVDFTSPTFTANLSTSFLGKFGTGSSDSAGPFWMDSLKVVTGATELIGPEVLPLLDFTAASGSGWSAVPSGTLIAALSDDDDATYAQTTDSPSGLTLDSTLPALATPSGDLLVRVRAHRNGATSGSLVPTLRDGSTTVATASTITLGPSMTAYLVTFPAASISGVTPTKWAAGTLVVRLAATAA